jgi:ABC-2 type transport system permease protein
LKAFTYLVLAHLKNAFRDRMTLFWFFVFPIVFMLIFGIVFGRDGAPSVFTVGTVDEEGEITATLGKSDLLRVFQEGEISSALRALRAGKYDLVIHIQKGKAVLYYSAQNVGKAQALEGHLKSMLLEAELRREGRSPTTMVEKILVEIPHFRQMDYFLPGVLAMALMQLGLFGSLDFVSLRERKIIRHLGATPLRRELLLWSEIMVRMGVSFLQTGLIITAGWLFFRVQVPESPSFLFWVLLGSATFVSLGYCIASFTKTIESAEGIIQMVQFPMMFLSGIFFPPEMMPESLRLIPRLLPLSYFGDALRHTMIGIPTQFGLTNDLLILLGWLGVSFFLAVRFFRWE